MIERLNTLRKKSKCTKMKVAAFLVDKSGVLHAEGINYSNDAKICANENKRISKSDNDKIVHAEICCIDSLDKGLSKEDIGDLAMGVSLSPCLNCAKKIVETGITELHFLTPFKNFDGIRYLLNNNVKVIRLKEDIYENEKTIVTEQYTILKKLDTDIEQENGLIVDTATANSVEEFCEVLTSKKFNKGDTVLVKMHGSLWLDSDMKYFLVDNKDITLRLDNVD